jgi:phosphatidylserine/phosphatidylglycerophosphate/cardiolipin synthase-like enzyme
VLDGLVRKASEAHFPRAIKAGVKIHEYGPALLHAKTLVVDERLVSIGSANLDNRLFALNNELNVVFQDGVIAAQLIKVFHQDLKLARAVDNDSVRRGWSGIFYLALLRSATSSKAAGWSWWRWEESNLTDHPPPRRRLYHFRRLGGGVATREMASASWRRSRTRKRCGAQRTPPLLPPVQ